jgi:hypothetical protein
MVGVSVSSVIVIVILSVIIREKRAFKFSVYRLVDYDLTGL